MDSAHVGVLYLATYTIDSAIGESRVFGDLTSVMRSHWLRLCTW